MTDSPNGQTSLDKSDSNNRLVLVDPFIGFVVAERYEILELIGAGGWGKVYKAKHVILDIEVAIKFVHQHQLGEEANIKRFEQEARLLSKIDSPNIVRIIDHGLSPAPFIVMEYFAGVPLNKWIQTNGAMAAQTAIDLFIQICDALDAAEALRIVHRDLKPANILLKMNGDVLQCKILDFGVAKFLDGDTSVGHITSTGEVIGSPAYMSPEQWNGHCDNRSDIYSLGCIMYEVLAGKPIFTAQLGIHYMVKHVSDTPQAITSTNSDVKLPAGLEDIVNKCIAKSPDNRYQTSRACAADLKQLKEGGKPSITLFEKVKRRTSKSFLAATCLLLVGLAATFVWHDWMVEKNADKLSTPADVGFSNLPDKWKNKSIGDWTAIIEANPNDADAMYNRALLHILRRDYGEAFRDLSDAIRVNPKYAEAYAERSITHLALNNDDNQYENALKDANKAISLKPSFARGYYARAFAYECMEQNEQAIIDSKKAIALGEKGSEVWDSYINVFENISTAYEVLGRYDEAEKAIAAGAKVVDPKYKWLTYRQSALVHYMKQEFAKALDDLTLASKESNCGPTVWSLMACCYFNLGQTSLAEDACFQGSREAGAATSYRRRAEYWRLAGKIDKAIADMGRAINLDRSKYYFNFRLRATYYIMKGQLNDALADLKESLTLNPNSAKTLSLLAVVEDKLGEKEKAQKYIQQAFALTTLPPIVFVNRATIEFHAERLNDALADLNKAISLDPYLKEAFALRKMVHEKLGLKKEAESDARDEKRLVTHVEFFT